MRRRLRHLDLIQEAQKGNPGPLIQQYEPWISVTAKRIAHWFRHRGYERDDVKQVLRMLIIDTAKLYRPRREFIGYLYGAVDLLGRNMRREARLRKHNMVKFNSELL